MDKGDDMSEKITIAQYNTSWKQEYESLSDSFGDACKELNSKDALIKELTDALEVSNQFIIASDNIELSEVTKESVIERADQALAHAKEQSNESTG